MINFNEINLSIMRYSRVLKGFLILGFLIFLGANLQAQQVVFPTGSQQKVQSFDKYFNSISSNEKKELSDLLFGGSNIYSVQNGNANSSEQPSKTARLSSEKDLAHLRQVTAELESIEALTINVQGESSIQLDDALLSKLPQLRFVYLSFDHFLTDAEVLSKLSLSNSFTGQVIYSIPE